VFFISLFDVFKTEAFIQKNGDVNPFTKQPHSAQYKKILESRKKLPVFNQMEEFMEIVSFHWVSLKLEEGFEFAIFSDGPYPPPQELRLIVIVAIV
jgi:hypothetical protein